MAGAAPSALSDHSITASKTMNLRRAHCLADGQLTPPSSPDDSRQRILRPGPRLQFSKLLRRPKQPKASRSGHIVGQLDREFVSNMREPFPLLLPESPTNTDCSSTSTVSPINPLELRRVSASYTDLRSVAARQSTSKRSEPPTPLLPSPITHELFEQDSSYFQFRNPRRPRNDGEYKSYEDLHILSEYYDDGKTESMHDIERELDDGNVSEASLSPGDGDNNSTSSEDLPQTPSSRGMRETFSSGESDWLANSKTPTERLRRFKARCYQVVQHPMDYAHDRKDENEITLARVLIGGKPKLVQISRPTSKASSQASRSKPPPPPPQTPIQKHEEISRFSPYDTPYDGIDQRVHNSTASIRSSTPMTQPSSSATSLVPAPLSLMTRKHSYQSSSTAFSNTRQPLHDLADPFGSIIRRSVSLPSRSNSITALPHHLGPGRRRPSSDYRYGQSLPPSGASSPELPMTSRSMPESHESGSRYNLVQTLAIVTSAINTYTFHSSFSPASALSSLDLCSPVVCDLRCNNVPDQEYINILGKIFPAVFHRNHSGMCGQPLFSALAAWILVDLYFCKAMTSLRSQHSQIPPAYTGPSTVQPPKPTNEGLQALTQTPRKPLFSRHHYSYSTLVNQSNSSLHRIPTKARDLLGITLSPPPHRRNQCPNTNTFQSSIGYANSAQHDIALLHRVIAVQQGVSVIGQKLVETLRGRLGFDQDIWRCLRVLIEVVEGGGGARELIAGSDSGYGRPDENERDNGQWV